MSKEKITLKKISATEEIKREIDIVSAHEDRPVYEILGDAWELYKQVAIGKGPIVKKNQKSVSVVDVISH